MMFGIYTTNQFEDIFKSAFGDLVGAILWMLLVGIVVGMIIATAIAYYNSCFLVKLLPVYCTCY